MKSDEVKAIFYDNSIAREQVSTDSRNNEKLG